MDTDTKELLNFTLRYLLLNFIIIIIGMRKRIITGDKQEVLHPDELLCIIYDGKKNAQRKNQVTKIFSKSLQRSGIIS